MKLLTLDLMAVGPFSGAVLDLSAGEHGLHLVYGPNEAGKTAVLQALQQINPPPDVPKFDALRDYPRSKYNDITTGRVDPKTVTRWATQGAIPSFRTPRGQHRFLTSDVVALVLQQTQES